MTESIANPVSLRAFAGGLKIGETKGTNAGWWKAVRSSFVSALLSRRDSVIILDAVGAHSCRA